MAVYVAAVAFSIAIGMGEGELKVVVLEIDQWIEAILSKNLPYQVCQTILASDDLSVEDHSKAFIEICVVPESLPDEVLVIGIGAEYGWIVVRNEGHKCAVGLISLPPLLLLQLSPLEDSMHVFAFSPGSDFKVF